ncbi:MAG: S9 family peptidase [Bacteroides sp.]
MRVWSLWCAIPIMSLLGVSCNPQLEIAPPVVKDHVVMADALTSEEIEARQLTPEILWKMGRLGTISLSPDRSQVLYTVTHYNVREGKSGTRIYVQGVVDKEARLLYEGGNAPAWHSEGKCVYFLKNIAGVQQLFEIGLEADAQAKQLTTFSEGIESYWVSPDNKRLLYSRKVQVEKTAKELYPEYSQANVRIIDSLMYRHWDYWVDGQYSHLFLTELTAETISEGRDLQANAPYDVPMAPYFDGEDVAWSPKSDAIYYACKKQTGVAYATGTNSDVYRYDLNNGTTTNLTEGNLGYDKQPVPSPDGTKLLWQQMRTPGYESDRMVLMLLDLTTGEKQALTETWDQNAESFQWSKDGKAVYIISGIKGTVQLFELALENRQIRQLTDGQWNITWAGLTANNDWLVATTQLNRGAELYTYRNNACEPFTHINRDIYSVIKFSNVEGRWIRTTNGEQMLTWIVFPPDFDSTKRYPTLLYCQGGPQSTVSQFFSYRWNLQLMASQGYIVVAPNRHGVPSFGQAWNAQISGDYSGQNIRDYLSAIDDVAKEPWCDKEHLGAVGASYGGYSVYYLAGVHNNRFKAFIAHNGMFNFESFYNATEETFFPNHDFGGAYWDKTNYVAQRTFANSPHLLVKKWTTPIMIVVGERDFRIPYTEGLQAFNAAQLLGIPSRLCVYPEETHFVSRPQNAIIWQHEFFNWLDRWLKH